MGKLNKSSLFHRTVLITFLIFLLSFTFKSKANARNEKPYFTDIGQFNYAKFLMGENDFKVAAREFARLIENFPASPLIPEAQFRMAEAYFNSGSYQEAEVQFRLFISNFSSNPLVEEAAVKLIESQSRLKKDLPLAPVPEYYPERRPNLRAVQVMLFEGKTLAQVEQELKRLKDSGIDTIIVRAFHNSGDRYYPFASPKAKAGVYFKTTHAPVVDDSLSGIIHAARRQDLKVFAWMTTRYADYGIENEDELACRGYDISTRQGFKCKGLDLFNEKAVKRLEALYSDLAEYDIDGILFQDDLVLRHNEGFGTSMSALYKKETGRTINPESLYLRVGEKPSIHYTQLFWEWASWKNKRLLTVAQRLKEVVHKKRPETRFAINLMYESLTNPPFALAWLSQNLEEANKVGFDYYSIMAYHRQMGQELNKDSASIKGMIEKMVEEASRTIGEPHRVLIKLQTIDWKTGAPLSNAEVVDLIRDVKSVKDVSLAVVPYRGDFPFNELGFPNGVALLNRQ
ncbi:MAG: outer membrane protein assembly factor BamD [Deltaproteobacteria bacterium]|nr:outer membrane protein assembly factor BamD [Deltaproteobacteria bacterium]